jgi:flavin reductase (DIM6/NTAB) family NADH-FMN oxidoreductase RutF
MAVTPDERLAKTKVPLSLERLGWRPTPLMNQVTLVTTLNEDGSSNVAPKSCVSLMIFRPLLLALGCNLGHWTARNLRRGGECVVNVPGAELAAVAWESSERPHPRTIESLGLTPAASRELRTPGIAECRAHFECVLEREIVYGEEVVLLLRVVAASLDQEVIEAPDPYAALRLFAFLEEKLYGVVERGARL